MRYARINDAVVAELITLPVGVDINDAYHHEIAATFVLCEDEAVEQGWSFNGEAFSPPVAEERSFVEIKAELKSGVDIAAETERLKYITPGAGQAMTYQQKVDEARAFKAASNPQTSDYLILSSEVGITAETLSEVADVVLAAFAQWQQIGAAIEAVRLGAKRDIDAAADEAAARSIVDAIEWP
ncbi:hypothetical protein [Brucella intermedia]|uniref:hypothetical protein n=1 Tax=Brucella intermedia TaxID=94625 RepID=UPI00244BA1FD|nr:hypothetical protein [Brucella intermedia]WGG58173.1 hypothetical protein QA414_07300 [Brucella intermedia]